MSWLTTDALPVVSGWGGPPKLEAPNIGTLVGNILENRRLQQANTQKSIADAIKEFQSQRQASTFGTALQNEGLVSPGTDVSGMSSADLARLVQARLEQTPDTEMDAYHMAAAAKEQAMADAIKSGNYGGGGGGNNTGAPEIVEKDGIRYLVNRTSKSVTYHRLPGQYGPTRTEQENVAPSLPQQTVYPDDPSAQPNATPSPNPDVTITPTPPPADQSLAPGYGVKAVTMKAPDGTVSSVDPNLVEYYKSKGAVIVPGP